MRCAEKMIRAVLDSSVLFSAFIKPDRLPGMLLDRAGEGAFALYLSTYILDETARALLRAKHRARYGYSPAEVAGFRASLVLLAEMVGELPALEAVPDDPKDNPVLATAIAARAGYLVTGDRRHLLPLRTYEGVRILSPRDFIDLL
jgi:uncharacterized protein